MTQKLGFSESEMRAFCRDHHIARLCLFGSILRDDFSPQSDVDVLVEFEPDHVPGFLSFVRMENELSSMMNGRKVDLNTPGSLLPSIREEVEKQAEVMYAGS